MILLGKSKLAEIKAKVSTTSLRKNLYSGSEKEWEKDFKDLETLCNKFKQFSDKEASKSAAELQEFLLVFADIFPLNEMALTANCNYFSADPVDDVPPFTISNESSTRRGSKRHRIERENDFQEMMENPPNRRGTRKLISNQFHGLRNKLVSFKRSLDLRFSSASKRKDNSINNNNNNNLSDTTATTPNNGNNNNNNNHNNISATTSTTIPTTSSTPNNSNNNNSNNNNNNHIDPSHTTAAAASNNNNNSLDQIDHQIDTMVQQLCSLLNERQKMESLKSDETLTSGLVIVGADEKRQTYYYHENITHRALNWFIDIFKNAFSS